VLREVSNCAKRRNGVFNCGLRTDTWFRNSTEQDGAEATSGL